MDPISKARQARKDKCFMLKMAIELLVQGCGDTCDFCPIVKECETFFKQDPREWVGQCGLERRIV